MGNEHHNETHGVTITKGDLKADFWIEGKIDAQPGCSFIAKVYDVGSAWGIGDGPISKLEVSRDGMVVAAYDRGWDLKPESAADKAAVEIIRRAFPGRTQEATPEPGAAFAKSAAPVITRSERNRDRDDAGRER